MEGSSAEGGSKDCIYPQSNATAVPISSALDAVAANSSACTSVYLDTVENMSNDGWFSREGDDHHQGLARTHKLSDGAIYFFLSHSELDDGDQGMLAQFRYTGPTDQEHVLETSPLTVAPMAELLRIDEQHPSDIEFLPDVNHADAGYLFVTEEFTQRRVSVYRWAPFTDLVLQGRIFQGFPAVIPDASLVTPSGIRSRRGGPNFVFVDKFSDYYYLGIASYHWGWGQLLRARDTSLFPRCAQARLDVSAFKPVGMFPFPVLERGGASQVKLVRDAEDKWYLLAFRSDPPGDEKGDDYVDVYGVEFEPFAISYLLDSIHVTFRPGDTGFASTGTHYVEPSGRLLLLSSYRWAEDEGPGNSSYVSRVDECPSL